MPPISRKYPITLTELLYYPIKYTREARNSASKLEMGFRVMPIFISAASGVSQMFFQAKYPLRDRSIQVSLADPPAITRLPQKGFR